MSLDGINDRISDYSLSPHRLHWILMMGCASSQSGGLPGNAGHEKSTDGSSATAADNELSAKYPPAEAFEISLDEVDNDNGDRSDSLIKKHPPKRLQKLVEHAATSVSPTTIEHLEEKLAKAEVRRQQYIQQRIENIIALTAKGGGNASGTSGVDGGNDQNDGQNDEQNDGGNANTDGEAVIVTSSSQDVDSVQPTLNETVPSVNEHIETDGDHGADNRIHS